MMIRSAFCLRRRLLRSFVRVCVVIVTMLTPLEATAQSSLPPWHDGVTAEAKEQARALHSEAIELHKKLLISEAVEKYREALRHWDQPQIHFHLSRALSKLDRAFEAYESLRASLRWGPLALNDDDKRIADELEKQLLTQLARIEVRCHEPRAQVSLNDDAWFVGESTESKVVRPGFYLIRAEKNHYHTVTQAVSLFPGKSARVDLYMSQDEGTVVTRRWAAWRPWMLAGTGATMTIAAAGLLWSARDDIARFDEHWLEACIGEKENGCYEATQPALIGNLQQALWKNRFATGFFVVGGSALLTGLALAAINSEKLVTDKTRGKTTFSIEPIITDVSLSITTRVVF